MAPEYIETIISFGQTNPIFTEMELFKRNKPEEISLSGYKNV